MFSLPVFFEPAEAKKSSGTYLTEIGSKKICGDKLCDAPQSIAEKIAAFLESQRIREGDVEQQKRPDFETKKGKPNLLLDKTIPGEPFVLASISNRFNPEITGQESYAPESPDLFANGDTSILFGSVEPTASGFLNPNTDIESSFEVVENEDGTFTVTAFFRSPNSLSNHIIINPVSSIGESPGANFGFNGFRSFDGRSIALGSCSTLLNGIETPSNVIQLGDGTTEGLDFGLKSVISAGNWNTARIDDVKVVCNATLVDATPPTSGLEFLPSSASFTINRGGVAEIPTTLRVTDFNSSHVGETVTTLLADCVGLSVTTNPALLLITGADTAFTFVIGAALDAPLGGGACDVKGTMSFSIGTVFQGWAFDIIDGVNLEEYHLECYEELKITNIIDNRDRHLGVVVTGTNDNDLILASNLGDDVFGLRGDDCIFGGTSKDKLNGDSGNDIIHGGSGNDIINGNAGDDAIYGDDGNDKIRGGNGEDYIFGGEGDDEIFGESGKDELSGDAGNDKIYGGDGDDGIVGGPGKDMIRGGAGNDFIVGDDCCLGGGDADTIFGDAGKDTIKGGVGNDKIFGGKHADTINGDDGDDEISGGAGNDEIYGDDGDDTISGGAGFDDLTGGAGKDTIFGDAGQDFIEGGADDDTINGGGDSDYIDGNAGQDTVNGGAGDDTCIFERGDIPLVSCEEIIIK